MDYIVTTLENLAAQTAFASLTWGNYLMIAVACFFLYLAIKKGYEPLLLLPISFLAVRLCTNVIKQRRTF